MNENVGSAEATQAKLEKRVMLQITSAVPDVFDPSIEGVFAITKAGTSVPAGKEAKVKKAARRHGVGIGRVR